MRTDCNERSKVKRKMGRRYAAYSDKDNVVDLRHFGSCACVWCEVKMKSFSSIRCWIELFGIWLSDIAEGK